MTDMNFSTRQVERDPESYCVDCGIQFISRETLLGHKKYYCSTSNTCSNRRQRLRSYSEAASESDSEPATGDAVSVGVDAETESLSRAREAQGRFQKLLANVLSSAVGAGAVTNNGLDARVCPTANWMSFPGLMPNLLLQPPPLVLATPVWTGAGIQYVPVASGGSAAAAPPPPALPFFGVSRPPAPPLPPTCLPLAPLSVPTLLPPPPSILLPPNNRRQLTSRPQSTTREERDRSGASSPAKRRKSVARVCGSPPLRKCDVTNFTKVDRQRSGPLTSTTSRASLKSGSETALDLTMKNENNSTDNRSNGRSEFVCNRCSVTFYKRENYVAHKNLYCAQRHRVFNGENRSGASDSARAATSPNDDGASESVVSDSLHQCVPCGIMFKSNRTLEAHKQSYCPFRNDSSSSARSRIMDRSRVNLEQDGEPASEVKQPPIAANERPNRVIQRSWKCEICEESCFSLERLSDHVRSHSVAIYFSCKLCGYRGNTVRGLKIHGKLHVDEGVLFNDDSIAVLRKAMNDKNGIAIALLNAIQSQRDTPLHDRRKHEEDDVEVDVDVDVEVEVDVDVDAASESGSVGARISCARCRRTFVDVGGFESHKVTCAQPLDARSSPDNDSDSNSNSHSISNSKEVSKSTAAARVRSTGSSNLSLTAARKRTRAPESIEAASVLSNGSGLAIGSSTASSTSGRSAQLKSPAVKICRNCGIVFKHLTTYIAHQKYYCRKKSVQTKTTTPIGANRDAQS